jgi:uncharacterized protein with PIN domain
MSQGRCVTQQEIPYLTFFSQSDRRYKRGERQTRCRRCFRYYWPRWEWDRGQHVEREDELEARP